MFNLVEGKNEASMGSTGRPHAHASRELRRVRFPVETIPTVSHIFESHGVSGKFPTAVI